MTRRLFVDLDGVLANFDKAAVELLGCYGWEYEERYGAAAFWGRIHESGSFFRNLELMPDARELWDYCCRLVPEPVVLTGVPRDSSVPVQKRAWVLEHLGHDRVVTCASRDKCLYGKPGDVLVDDWDRYRSLWEEMGGVFVLHTSAADTVMQLEELFG